MTVLQQAIVCPTHHASSWRGRRVDRCGGTKRNRPSARPLQIG